ncbi:hypothetical protein C0995_008436 [Termitomyces sp. Mi166|nr:hypothetical protein C0995_008436 [Termitomyces sp. Mi166\
MSSTPIVDYLTKQIFIERSVASDISFAKQGAAPSCQYREKVSYSILGNSLFSKERSELSIYHENAPYQSQISYATYLVCGEIDPPYVDEMNMDYDEGKDVEGDFEDDGDDVPQMKLLLVNELDLEVMRSDAKLQFTRINSIHVYSLSPSPLRDAGHICTPTEHVRSVDHGKDAKEMIRIVGKIVGANIKIVQPTSKGTKSTRQPVAGPSRSKPTSRSAPAEVKAKEASTEPAKEQNKMVVDKPKDKPKATGKLDFSKAKLKEKKSDASMEATKGKREKEVEGEPKENKEKEKEKEEMVSVMAQQPKKTTEPAKKGTKRKSALEISDSEEERKQPPKAVSRHASPIPKAKENVRVKGRALISDDEDEVTKPVRKPRKGRAAVAVDSDNEEVLAMMNIDDDQVTRVLRDNRTESEVDREENDDHEEEEDKSAAVDEDVDMDDVTVPKAKPRKRVPKKVIPVGKNGLKKRRVVKSRSRVDEKGYMGASPFLFFALCGISDFIVVVFEDYSEYESVDEEESGPTRAKGKTKAKAKIEQESDNESVPAPKLNPSTKSAVQKEPLKAKGAKSGAGRTKGAQKQGNLAGFFTAKPKK